MALPITLRTKLSISITSVRLFHASSPLTQGIIITPPERITFTFPVINSSAYIALVVTGAAEAGAVQNALGNSQNSEKLPVAMVSPEGELAWFLDTAAASKL